MTNPIGAGSGPRPIEFIGGFESTYMPAHDTDVTETNGHDTRWPQDLALMRDAGVTRLRYPIRWHRIEQAPGRFDWSHTDAVMDHMQEHGMQPIVDLVHHTSYPRWLHNGFADRRFPSAYLRYVECFATRYPWVREYTLFNEPFATLFLCGSEGIWPPYGQGMDGFARLVSNVLPPIAEASRLYAEILPEARHLWVDTCEHHSADPAVGPAMRHAVLCNDRRFVVLDLMLGRCETAGRPFAEQLVGAAGPHLLALPPGRVDVLGLDYYAHSEWFYDRNGGVAPPPRPRGLASLAIEYWNRYRLPVMLSETNLRGYASDRATWLRYTLAECEQARDEGVPLEGYCWFPFVDSCDWDSLLARCEGNIDPVGVHWLDEHLTRHESSMSVSYRRAAAGVPSQQLPAYSLHPPVATWLRGYADQVAGSPALEPPDDEDGSRGTPHIEASALSFGVRPIQTRLRRSA
jgi:beta-glucosidase/6-phospho-beta-glucosidase/beta-galactosidase